MPELTPQQKLLEKLYRGETKAHPPTLKQKSLNRSLNKPSVSNAQKAAGATPSRSAAFRSKIRSTKAAYKTDLTRFGKEVTAASRKARVSSAQNISKFGGGVKARLGPTVVAVKTIAVKQGVRTPALGRLLAGGGRFFAYTKANPGLALIVGNLIIWKKNVEDIKKIYDYGNTPVDLSFPKVVDVIENVKYPYRGGHSGVKYHVFGTYTSKDSESCDQLAYWRSSIALIGSEVNSWQPLEPTGGNVVIPLKNGTFGQVRPMSKSLWDARNMGDSGGLSIGQRSANIQCDRTTGITFGHTFKITELRRVDYSPDIGEDPPPIAEPVTSRGGVSTGDFIPQPREQKPAPLVLPETESEILAKPLTMPVTSPKVEPVPTIVPEVEPNPEEDKDTQPTSPTEPPPVKEVDPTKPAIEEKPKKRFSKTQKYPATREEMGDVFETIERESAKYKIESRPSEGDEVEDRGWYTFKPNPFLRDAMERAGFDVKERHSTKISESPQVRKVVTAPTIEEENKTATGTQFPIVPLPGVYRNPTTTTTVRNPPAPAPTVTPVSSCQKGCAGAPVALNQADSNNLAGLNAGLQAADLGLLAVINNKLGSQIANGGISSAMGRLHKSLAVDRWLNLLNTALLFHNAFQLSSIVFDTLGSIFDNVMQTLGINFTDVDGGDISLRSVVNRNISNLVASIFGRGTLDALTSAVKKGNRFYQASANLLSNVRSIFDASQDIAETTGENVAAIGNALRQGGVVRENAYKFMPENLNNTSRVLNKLENASETLDAIEDITSNTVDIREEMKEMKESKKEFDDARKELIDNKTREASNAKTSITQSATPSELDEERAIKKDGE